MKRACKQAGFSSNFHFRKKFDAGVITEMTKCTVVLNVSAGCKGQKGKYLNMRVFEVMENSLYDIQAQGLALCSHTYESRYKKILEVI